MDTGHDARADGGRVCTSDADFVANDYVTDLEAVLDWVVDAVDRARSYQLGDRGLAHLQLAENAARLAFYARSPAEREVGLHEARTHLDAILDSLADQPEDHPVRHALQLLASYEGGETA